MSSETLIKEKSTHFAGLDGLRGVAAGAVVLFHVFLPLHIYIATKGYLAVDFFFLLSGFVVANAYDRRLRSDMSFGKFAWIRTTRLYPLLLLGMVLGCIVSLVKTKIAHSYPMDMLAEAFVWAVFLLPFGRSPHSDLAFPFNGPAWSLFFEFVINFFYAAVARFLSDLLLVLLIACAAVGLAWTTLKHGDAQMGAALASFDGGLARVTFSFFTGLLLWRLQKLWRVPRIPGGQIFAAVILAAVLLHAIPTENYLYDLISVFFVFPIIILLSIADEPVGRVRDLAIFLGALSYPLYMTHHPIMRIFQTLAESRHLHGVLLGAMCAVEFVAMFVAAWCALVWYDEPIQKWLKGKKKPSPAPVHDLTPVLGSE